MPQEFDPYFEWLKIPPAEQPPNHYRLLGVNRFESDPTVIDSAVSKLVAKLQHLSNGRHVEHAQRILNDAAKARLCLLDTDKKSDFDRQLRAASQRGRGDAQTVPPRASTGPSSRPAAASTSTPPSLPRKKPTAQKSLAKNRPKKSRPEKKSSLPAKQNNSNKLLIGYGAGMLVSAGATAFLLNQFFSQSHTTVAQLPNETQVVSSVPDQTPPPNNPIETETENDDPDQDTERGLKGERAGENAAVTDGPSASQAQSISPVPSDLATAVPSVDDTLAATLPPKESPLGSAVPPPLGSGLSSGLGTPPPPNSAESGADLLPDQLDVFESKLSEFVHVRGTVASVSESGSGKTRYIHFSNDWDETIMVYLQIRDVGGALHLAELNSYLGKTIRVRGEIKKQFGTNKTGIRIASNTQIEVIE